MEYLISMIKFVLNGQQTADYIKLYNGCFKYAKFLSKKIEIWMFIPCKLVGGVWVVLEEPKTYLSFDMQEYDDLCKEYQEAKERCLFNFEMCVGKEAITNYDGTIIRLHDQNTCFSLNGKQIFIIENLVECNLKLTQSSKKQIE